MTSVGLSKANGMPAWGGNVIANIISKKEMMLVIAKSFIDDLNWQPRYLDALDF